LVHRDTGCKAFGLQPFVFCEAVTGLTSLIQCPTFEDDPAKTKPLFSRTVDRRHPLFKLHEAHYPILTNPKEGAQLRDLLREVETNCITEVEEVLDTFDPLDETLELAVLFDDSVDAEARFYK